MWKLVDSNKIIGTHMKVPNTSIKVESYKTHLSKLKKVKSQLNISAPWKPSFSLSKRLNKYHKCTLYHNDSRLDKSITREWRPSKPNA